MIVCKTSIRSVCAVVTALGVGCAVHRAPSPSPSPSSATTHVLSSASAPTSASTAVFSVVLPDRSLAPKVFTVLPPIAFKPRKNTAKLTLLHADRSRVDVAPDGTTMLASSGGEGTIFSLAHPKGIAVDVADVFETAFAADSSLVAVAQARATLELFALPSGNVIWEADTDMRNQCGLVVSGSTLMFHDQSFTGPGYAPGRLWRIDVPPSSKNAKATPLGQPRYANRCWAAPDASHWLVADDNGKPNTMHVVSATGAEAPLLDVEAEGSPIADRACFPAENKSGYLCAKVGEARLEALGAAGEPNPWLPLQFDDTGARALYALVRELPNGDIEQTHYVADFEAATVQAVRGVDLRSGGTLRLLSGGHVVVAGSASGVEVYDLDAATFMKIPVNAFYGVQAIQGRPRALFVFQEIGSDWKAWLAELPK